MDPETTSHEDIRRLLHRRELAAARHRSAVSRQLGLAESEMLAVSHLAQRGQLTPSDLAALLDLSSGGVSALVQRLEDAGHIVRHQHPTDGRSSLVRLSSTFSERAGRAFGPLVREIDALSSGLLEEEQTVLRSFLERLVDVSEQHAQEARERAEGRADADGSAPIPSLWS